MKLSLLNSVLINSRFNPLYRKTLKRQRTFASLEDAMAYFSSRRALARFHPEALAAYVEGTREAHRWVWRMVWRFLVPRMAWRFLVSSEPRACPSCSGHTANRRGLDTHPELRPGV